MDENTMTTAVRDMLYMEDVLRMLKVSRSTVERMERDKSFPKGHTVRGRRVWFAEEIANWQDTLPAWKPPRRKRVT